MIIDLRSDTVTRPTKAMLEAMIHSPTGDDVFGEDPTVLALEKRMADMFGHEAGLFCASGTMANQIAIKAQTQPMDEIIAHELCHIYYYETGGYAFNSGVSIKLLRGHGGIMQVEEVEANIQPDYDWLPRTSLVTLENTCNKGGGTCYPLKNMQEISALAKRRGLKMHLDGARIFNAMEVMGYGAGDIGPLFDTISICFSKGLGAPVGSILTGSAVTIRKARRIRKVFGGGMRQAGLLAGACLYALDHHLPKLKADREHALRLAHALGKAPWVEKVYPVATNIVIFDVATPEKQRAVLDFLELNGIRAISFGHRTIRMVTHLDILPEHIHLVEEKIKEMPL